MNYHDAGAYSRCCAMIIVRLNEILPNVIDQFLISDCDIKKDTAQPLPHFSYNHYVRPADFCCNVPLADIDHSNLFYQKKVVVTGDFAKISREELYQVIVNMGGQIVGSVSRRTDYLLVGNDFDMTHKTTKHKKAEEINACAIDSADMVTIMFEDDVMPILYALA
jgi:NAD-dependent DNA ligase